MQSAMLDAAFVWMEKLHACANLVLGNSFCTNSLDFSTKDQNNSSRSPAENVSLFLLNF